MIAFDFDGTLIDEANRPNMTTISLLRRCLRDGLRVRVITSRNPAHECVIWRNANEPRRVLVAEFLSSEELPLQVTFTSHKPKAIAMRQLGVDLLFDNEWHEIEAARAAGLSSVLVNPQLRAGTGADDCLTCGWSTWYVGRRGDCCVVCGHKIKGQKALKVTGD